MHSFQIVYTRFIKTFLDRLTALIVLIAASPLLLICMMGLAIVNQGKVWFIQARPGKGSRIFNIIKFRTMADLRDTDGNQLPDKERMTAIGTFIRKLSLDEIPQLINVLKGDMSIVGPRPLLIEYLPLYNAEQARRHNVKPGITGWAQVNGRNAIGWSHKFELDVWYVDHVSFAIDVKILFLTVLKIVKREGITSSTSVTMEKFRGNA
mgnify:FL=1